MWTGRESSRWALVLTLSAWVGTAGTACQDQAVAQKDELVPADPAPAESGEAWWLAIEFPPDSTAAHGYSLEALDPSWKRVRALEAADVRGRVSEAALTELEQSLLRFETQADLDGDGEAEEVFVGTFQSQDDSTGRFLAIARNDRILAHFAEPGPPGFSAALFVDGELRWYKCLACGDYDTVVPTGSGFALE